MYEKCDLKVGLAMHQTLNYWITYSAPFEGQHHYWIQGVSVDQSALHKRKDIKASSRLTMLNHDWIGPESLCMRYIRQAPKNGNAPKIRLIVLYLPIAWIIVPAKREPMDIDMLFCRRCNPVIRQTIDNFNHREVNTPATDALVFMTVWNHIGK